MEMDINHLAMKYWDAADGITAFACVHMVAFLLSLLSENAQATVAAAPWITRGSVVFFWLLYCAGICLAVYAALNLLGHVDTKVVAAWQYALWGRLCAVSILSLVLVLALFGKPIDHKQGSLTEPAQSE